MVVRGNCDAEVDEMISEFTFEDHIFENINGKNVYFTHGHRYNIENIPYDDFEILIYGHIHQGFIETNSNHILMLKSFGANKWQIFLLICILPSSLGIALNETKEPTLPISLSLIPLILKFLVIFSKLSFV